MASNSILVEATNSNLNLDSGNGSSMFHSTRSKLFPVGNSSNSISSVGGHSHSSRTLKALKNFPRSRLNKSERDSVAAQLSAICSPVFRNIDKPDRPNTGFRLETTPQRNTCQLPDFDISPVSSEPVFQQNKYRYSIRPVSEFVGLSPKFHHNYR